MPYSSNIFNKKVIKIIKLVKPRTCMDIGIGAGKYGMLIKTHSPSTKITGVEIEKDYIDKFDLSRTYDEIWNIPAADIISPKYYDLSFDLIILGDVLEHMKKSSGIDLLNFLVYRAKFIIAIFPYKYLQNSIEGYDSEAHISIWCDNDFLCFDSTTILSRYKQCLIAIKGYLKSTVAIGELNNILK